MGKEQGRGVITWVSENRTCGNLVRTAWTRLNASAPLTTGNRSSCKEERLRGYLAVHDGQLHAEDISDIETAGFEVSELRRREMQAGKT